jgi:hypothetical protein
LLCNTRSDLFNGALCSVLHGAGLLGAGGGVCSSSGGFVHGTGRTGAGHCVTRGVCVLTGFVDPCEQGVDVLLNGSAWVGTRKASAGI